MRLTPRTLRRETRPSISLYQASVCNTHTVVQWTRYVQVQRSSGSSNEYRSHSALVCPPSFCLHVFYVLENTCRMLSCWKAWDFNPYAHTCCKTCFIKSYICLEKLIYYVTLLFVPTLLFLLMFSWKLCLSDCNFNMLDVLTCLQQVWFWTWLLLIKCTFLSVYNHLIHMQHFENVVYNTCLFFRWFWKWFNLNKIQLLY